MPTTSQSKILTKLGTPLAPRMSARALALQRVEEVASSPIYVPPARKIFSKQIDLNRLNALQAAKENGERTFFPEMTSMTKRIVRPGTAVEAMSADDIMTRLCELGWRRPGTSDQTAAEKRKREQERQRMEEEQAVKRRETLDLVNDPLLRRVKEKNQTMAKYATVPDSRPLAVCFDILGPSLAHSTVKMKLDELFDEIQDSEIKLVSLEYQPRAMHIKSTAAGNRWVINLDSPFGVAELEDRKLTFGKQEVELKRYDDVISTEFKTFTRQNNFKKQFNMN